MTKIGIYNHLDGTQEVRDMTPEELSEYQSMVEAVAAKKAEEKTKKEEAEAALLASLNITREQAITLKLIQPDYVAPFGGN